MISRINSFIQVYLLTLILILLSINYTFGQLQENILTRYSVNEGLPQSTVNHITQDSKGFIWIGTCGGLCRFDGYEFITFKSHPDYQNTLSNNFVRAIHEDARNNLWIGCEIGLDLMKTENLKITQPFQNRIKFTNTSFVFYSTKDFILLTDNNGKIYKYWLNSKKLSVLFNDRLIYSLSQKYLHNNNSIWLYNSTEKCILQYSIKENKINKIKLSDQIVDKYLYTISVLDANSIIFCFDKRNIIVDTENKKIRTDKPPFPLNEIYKFYIKDNNNNHWIFKANGSIDLYSSKFEFIETYFSNEKPWKTQPVSYLFADKENNLWIGTDGSDIFKFSPHLQKFKTVRFDNSGEKNSNFIKCFYKKNNNKLLISTFDGLFFLDSHLKKNKKVELSNNKYFSVNKIVEIEDNILLFATNDGLFIYNYSQENVIQHLDKALNQSNKISDIKSILKHSSGRYLLGCYEGIYELRKNKKNKFELFLLTHFSSSNLYETNQNLLINSQLRNGICVLKLLNDTLILDKKYLLPGQYSYSAFRHFYIDKKQRLWAAASIGLVLFSKELNIQRIFTEFDGLPDNDVYGILEDKSGKLWLSTNKGISVFDGKKFKNYDVDDGLQSNEFNSNAFFSDHNIFYFGGINGFNYFNPNEISNNKAKPSIYITHFEVIGDNGKNYTPEIENDKIKLKYFENFISIEITSLQFSNIQKNKFAYFLSSYDKKWIYQGNRKNIRFNNLPPGNYQLWVKACNHDQVWGDAQKIIIIEITPPFYQTLVFKLLLLLLTISLISLTIYIYIKYKINKQKRIIEQLKRIEEVRVKISRDLHDNAGAELTRISMISELAKLDCKSQKDITPRLEQITQSSKNLVENFKEIIWATNPQNDNLQSLIIYIRSYVSDFLENTNVDPKFDLPENCPEITIEANVRRNIFLIIKEWTNNVVKHSGSKTYFISIKTVEHELIIELLDHGCGLKPEAITGRGNGLRNIIRRAEEINAHCQFANHKTGGSKLELSISTLKIT